MFHVLEHAQCTRFIHGVEPRFLERNSIDVDTGSSVFDLIAKQLQLWTRSSVLRVTAVRHRSSDQFLLDRNSHESVCPLKSPTLAIFLNSVQEGGELLLLPDGHRVRPRAGLAVFLGAPSNSFGGDIVIGSCPPVVLGQEQWIAYVWLSDAPKDMSPFRSSFLSNTRFPDSGLSAPLPNVSVPSQRRSPSSSAPPKTLLPLFPAGWGNQGVAVQEALILGRLLGRRVLLPPLIQYTKWNVTSMGHEFVDFEQVYNVSRFRRFNVDNTIDTSNANESTMDTSVDTQFATPSAVARALRVFSVQWDEMSEMALFTYDGRFSSRLSTLPRAYLAMRQFQSPATIRDELDKVEDVCLCVYWSSPSYFLEASTPEDDNSPDALPSDNGLFESEHQIVDKLLGFSSTVEARADAFVAARFGRPFNSSTNNATTAETVPRFVACHLCSSSPRDDDAFKGSEREADVALSALQLEAHSRNTANVLVVAPPWFDGRQQPMRTFSHVLVGPQYLVKKNHDNHNGNSLDDVGLYLLPFVLRAVALRASLFVYTSCSPHSTLSHDLTASGASAVRWRTRKSMDVLSARAMSPTVPIVSFPSAPLSKLLASRCFRVAEPSPGVITVRHALSPRLTADLVAYFDASTDQFQSTVGSGTLNTTRKIRTDVVMWDDAWQAVLDDATRGPLFGEANLRFGNRMAARELWKMGRYRADEGGFYLNHRDTWGHPYRKVSALVVLGDDFGGGGTRFAAHEDDMVGTVVGADGLLEPGTAVLFESSRMHGAAPVLSGVRYALICFLYGQSALDASVRGDDNLAAYSRGRAVMT